MEIKNQRGNRKPREVNNNPRFYLKICDLMILEDCTEDTARKHYEEELRKVNKTKEQGLTIFDYCRNHKCYVAEACAKLRWDYSKLLLPPLFSLQTEMLRSGKIETAFVG
jgi:hypothetical protein